MDLQLQKIKRLLNGRKVEVYVPDNKYRTYIIPHKYSPDMVTCFNAQAEFLKEYIPSEVLNKNVIYEKSKIKWYSIPEMKREKKQAPPKSSKESGLSGFDMDSILSADSDSTPIGSSSGGSSVVVTSAAKEMESSAPSSVQSGVWDAPQRSSSAPTSVTSSQPTSQPQEHFSSVAPSRTSSPPPSQPKKKKR